MFNNYWICVLGMWNELGFQSLILLSNMTLYSTSKSPKKETKKFMWHFADPLKCHLLFEWTLKAVVTLPWNIFSIIQAWRHLWLTIWIIIKIYLPHTLFLFVFLYLFWFYLYIYLFLFNFLHYFYFFFPCLLWLLFFLYLYVNNNSLLKYLSNHSIFN